MYPEHWLIALQGDAVFLKAEGNQAWVGLICDFFEDEDEDNEKMAKFMWFASEGEIRNKSTKRTDFLPVRTGSLHHGIAT